VWRRRLASTRTDFGRLAMEADDGVAVQVAVNVAGAAALVAVGVLAAWFRAKSAERPRVPAPQQAADAAGEAGAGGGATLPAAVQADTA